MLSQLLDTTSAPPCTVRQFYCSASQLPLFKQTTHNISQHVPLLIRITNIDIKVYFPQILYRSKKLVLLQGTLVLFV